MSVCLRFACLFTQASPVLPDPLTSTRTPPTAKHTRSIAAVNMSALGSESVKFADIGSRYFGALPWDKLVQLTNPVDGAHLWSFECPKCHEMLKSPRY